MRCLLSIVPILPSGEGSRPLTRYRGSSPGGRALFAGNFCRAEREAALELRSALRRYEPLRDVMILLRKSYDMIAGCTKRAEGAHN